MLALEEKVRTIAVFRPELQLEGKTEEIIAKFEENYLEVKGKKQVYLTKEDAESFFHYQPPQQRAASVEGWTKGLSEVVVLEHLDGDVIDRTIDFVKELGSTYGEESIYCSQSAWESRRDMEFFFPHLDATPVERTLALIKPEGIMKGEIGGQTLEQHVESALAAAGLFVVGKRMKVLSDAEAAALCEDYADTEDYKGAMNSLKGDPGVIAMCVEGPGAILKWLLLCGPTNAGVCKDRAPTTIRAAWGTDSTSNAVHASSCMEKAEKELKLLFPEGTLQLQRTLCIVKPHAMSNVLQIRMAIEDAGFTVLKEKHTVLTEERAKEFYRDFKGQPTFNAMVQEATSGKCALLVLCRLEAVAVFQQLMGPAVVKDAKAFRPRSVRARFGRDGQKNAVHGSDTAKIAAWEVRFFFPELGTDPIPGDDEVRDFLFRKSAGASMDLKTLSSADSADYTLDPTLQQLISSGLLALCQVRPKGIQAITWFKDWLIQNNPNTTAAAAPAKTAAFNPPDRTKRFVEYGINQDGLPFSVEAPAPEKKKKVIDVDVTEELEETRVADFDTPPYVVFVVGGAAGSASGGHCAKLAEELNLVLLDAVALMQDEVAAATRLGTEVTKARQKGEQVPDAVALQILKKAMTKHLDVNRFLVEGFPRTAEQARKFEQEIAPVAFTLALDGAAEETQMPEQVAKVVAYYSPIGKVRTVNVDQDPEVVYAQMKDFFKCRFLYLMGPPGAPLAKVANKLELKYGYSSIDVMTLLRSYADSEERDAAKVKQALAKGKAVEASIACPLILAEIYRDLALGVHNFVICDFPQSLKQAEFLEFRVPCFSKPLLLDFTRADADDLAAMGTGGMEVELRTDMFFSGEMQAMIKGLPNLVSIPASLAEIDSKEKGRGPSTAEGQEEQLVDAVWEKVCEKVRPGLTLVLGLPNSGTDVLAPMLAKLTPNTYTVDCDQLLDKEMERKTQLGLEMHNMLARGQVVPLSMTLELVKDVVNLTCSDALVIENCPMYADQIETLSQEFRIDKVFYIAGNESATEKWRTKYVASCKGDDQDKHLKAFGERKKRLSEIVGVFARLGKLERLEVTETPKQAQLAELIDQATMPQFVVVTGLSTVITPKLSELVAAQLSAGSALTLEPTTEPAAEIFAKLKQHADSTGSPLLVLDRYLQGEEMATEFVNHFGTPQLVVNVSCEPEFIEEEFKAANEDMEDEEAAARMQSERAAYDAVVKVFEERCPSALLTIERSSMKAPAEEPLKAAEEMIETVRQKLVPKAYVVIAPSGEVDVGASVTDLICTSAKKNDRPVKFTVIDSTAIFQPGKHSTAIEDALHRASFTAEAADCLPAKLWVDLFTEAFSTSANPMGPFLITNFPTMTAVTSGFGPTVRDQFCMLEGIATLGGILHVHLSDDSYTSCCSNSPEDLQRYKQYDAEVSDQIMKQFEKERICECNVDSIGDTAIAKAAQQACTDFLSFLEKTE